MPSIYLPMRNDKKRHFSAVHKVFTFYKAKKDRTDCSVRRNIYAAFFRLFVVFGFSRYLQSRLRLYGIFPVYSSWQPIASLAYSVRSFSSALFLSFLTLPEFMLPGVVLLLGFQLFRSSLQYMLCPYIPRFVSFQAQTVFHSIKSL